MIQVQFFTDFSSPFAYLTLHYVNKIRDLYIPDLEITPQTFTLYEKETKTFHELLKTHLKVENDDEINLYYQDLKLIFEKENIVLNDHVMITNQTLAQIGLKYANDFQVGNHYVNLIYAAVFQDGYDISQEEVIFDVLEDLGLDIPLFKSRLAEGYYLSALKQDLLLVENLEVKQVPFMMVEQMYAVKTFYEYDQLLTLLLKIKEHLGV